MRRVVAVSLASAFGLIVAAQVGYSAGSMRCGPPETLSTSSNGSPTARLGPLFVSGFSSQRRAELATWKRGRGVMVSIRLKQAPKAAITVTGERCGDVHLASWLLAGPSLLQSPQACTEQESRLPR
jgi:hypothetical protein